MKIEDNKSTTKNIILGVMFAVVTIAIIVILVLVLTRKQSSPSSSDSSSTSEVSSLPISSSEYDSYIDETIANIKKYVKNVGSETLHTSLTAKDIYSINTYVDNATTHIVYGFTYQEENSRYQRFEIDINQELENIEDVIGMIHDDLITLDMFIGQTLYEVVNIDITSKDSFKELYPGTSEKHISYKDDNDVYYASSVNKDGNKYLSIDYLSFDENTFVIDNNEAHLNGTNNSNQRYYQLLMSII